MSTENSPLFIIMFITTHAHIEIVQQMVVYGASTAQVEKVGNNDLTKQSWLDDLTTFLPCQQDLLTKIGEIKVDNLTFSHLLPNLNLLWRELCLA